MTRFTLLVGASVLLIILKIGLVIYSNAIGDGLVLLNKEFSIKKTEIDNLKLVRDSVFNLRGHNLMDTIKTIGGLKEFVRVHDKKIERCSDELLALNFQQTNDLQKLNICNALNTTINILIVIIIAWLLVGRFRG